MSHSCPNLVSTSFLYNPYIPFLNLQKFFFYWSLIAVTPHLPSGKASESIRRVDGGSRAGASLDRTSAPVMLRGTRFRIWYDVEVAAVAADVNVATGRLNDVRSRFRSRFQDCPWDRASTCCDPDLDVVW